MTKLYLAIRNLLKFSLAAGCACCLGFTYLRGSDFAFTPSRDQLQKVSAIGIGGIGDGGRINHLTFIKDEQLAKKLLAAISQSGCVMGKAHMVSEFGVVFTDDKGNPVAGYMYWPSGEPSQIFMSYEIVFDRGKYFLREPYMLGHAKNIPASSRSLPVQVMQSFEQKISKYVNIWAINEE